MAITSVTLTTYVSANEGAVWGAASFISGQASYYVGNDTDPAWDNRGTFARFPYVPPFSRKTLLSAELKLWGAGNDGTAEVIIYGNDVLAPVAPTNHAEFDALTLTTASVGWSGPFSVGAWNTIDVTSIVSELIASYDTEAIQFALLANGTPGTMNQGWYRSTSYGDDATSPQLVLTYSYDPVVLTTVPFGMFFTAGGGGAYVPTLSEMQQLQAMGFNCLYSNNQNAAGLVAIRANAATAGLKMIVDFMGDLWDSYFTEPSDVPPNTRALAHVAADSLLDTIAGDDTVWAVMLDDEPTWARKNQLLVLKQAMQDYYPDILYFPGLIGTVGTLANYMQSDVLMLHTYPINANAAEGDLRINGDPANDVVTYIRASVSTLDPVIPYWTMMQGHGIGDGSESWHLRVPTVIEMRMQFWIALAEGAKGFVVFIWEWEQFPGSIGLIAETDLLTELSSLANKLPAMESVLLTCNRTTDIVTATGSGTGSTPGVASTHVTTLLSTTGSYYAAVVNRTISNQDITVTAPSPYTGLRNVVDGHVYRNGTAITFAPGEGLLLELTYVNYPILSVEMALTTNPTATPTWTDVTDYVQEIRIRRGRQRELDRIEAGTATLRLDNTDRRFDPGYAAGPYYGNLLPMRRVRVTAQYLAETYDVWYGYVESWPYTWEDAVSPVVTVQTDDGWSVLGRKILNTSYSAELSGARIHNILDDVGWTTGGTWILNSATDSQLGTTTILAPSGARRIAGGDTTIQATTLSDTTALAHAQDVALAENGILFMGKDGSVVFYNRHYKYGPDFFKPLYTFGDDVDELHYTNLIYDYDDKDIYNDIRMMRVGGAVQTASDATSQAKYFVRTLSQESLLASTDIEMLDRANWSLNRYKNPQIRISGIEFLVLDTDLWIPVLSIDLFTPVTVNRQPTVGAAIAGNYTVEGIEHSIVPGRAWRTAYRLLPVDGTTYWVLTDGSDGLEAYSVLGTTTVLAY